MQADVIVTIHPRADDPAADRAMLRNAVAPFVVSQRCPDCGGDHGRPIVDADGLWASLSRAGGMVAIAVSTAGPVGVDIESRAAADRFPLDSGAEPLEPVRLWTIKEAVLKADGRGLRCDPRELVIGSGPRLAAWADASFALDRLTLAEFELPDDIAGAVAVVAPGATMDLSAVPGAASRRSSAG